MAADLSDKVVVITGANSGIGLETTRGLGRMGGRVVMACRSEERGQAARKLLLGSDPSLQLEVRPLDLGDPASIQAFADAWDGPLDVLVNNAGIHATKRATTAEGLETTFATNHLGHFRLTNALLPALKAAPAARVLNVASIMHWFAIPRWNDLQMERMFQGTLAYSNSKLYNVWFSHALARRLHGTRVTSNALHPGSGGTGLTRDFHTAIDKGWNVIMKSAPKLAQTPIRLASDPSLDGVTGGYFHAGRRGTQRPLANHIPSQERLWQVSEGFG